VTGDRIVALGGGHGLAASLSALRRLTSELTAVVAVADDGGSTGRLRDAVDLPALGDLRKALVALAGADEPLARALHHRFGSGDIVGHAFGNLLIAALAESGDGLLAALDEVARLTGSVGRVLPSTIEPVVLHARTSEGREVIGQVRIMRTVGVERVSLVPARPEAPTEALEAIEGADLVVLGPGSLYTSVLAATAVPAVGEAVGSTRAPVVYVQPPAPAGGDRRLHRQRPPRGPPAARDRPRRGALRPGPDRVRRGSGRRGPGRAQHRPGARARPRAAGRSAGRALIRARCGLARTPADLVA
jgi:uncharacterized cofD-like protein